MSHTVLVTGGSGFIGTYLLRRLVERGDRAINFDVRPPGPTAEWWYGPAADQIQFVQGGVDDLSGVMAAVKQHQPDTIIHIAAIVDLAVLSQRHTLAMQVNLGGTLNILEAARLFGVRRVVYFSSIAVLPGLRYEPVDVNHAVMTAREILSHQFRLENITVRLELPETLPTVNAHSHRLGQVMVNLLTNAIEALKKKPNPDHTENTRMISIRTQSDGAWVVISIEDTGIGIPEHQVDRVTEPFFTTKTEPSGKGLGLSICDQIIRGYGGSVRIDSRYSAGTTVHVMLPCATK